MLVETRTVWVIVSAVVMLVVACSVPAVPLMIALCLHTVTFVFGVYDNVAELGCILYT